jgi:hypothetical protein
MPTKMSGYRGRPEVVGTKNGAFDPNWEIGSALRELTSSRGKSPLIACPIVGDG